jgi:putative ABC transport system substrate-binding protein
MQSGQLRRREFITLLGGAAAWPVAARAQQPAMPVIGYLGVSSFETSAGGSLLAFKRGLAETGYGQVRELLDFLTWISSFEGFTLRPTIASYS